MVDIHNFCLRFMHSLASPWRIRLLPALSPAPVPSNFAPRAQRSFAPEALPSFIALMTSCANPLPNFAFTLASQFLLLGPPALVLGTFPTFSTRDPSPDAWTFTPAASGCIYPFLPPASAFPKTVAGRRLSESPHNDFCAGPFYGTAVSLDVQASQVCLTTRVVPTLALSRSGQL